MGRKETNYQYLICKKAIHNRSTYCSVAAPEETQGWKAGSKVSFCASCKTEVTVAEFISKNNAFSRGPKYN